MKTIPQNYKKTARFRRWSRAGYAVFQSLTCEVTIGVLAAGICEKALLKNTPSDFSKNNYSSNAFSVESEEEKFRAEELLEKIQLDSPVLCSVEGGKILSSLNLYLLLSTERNCSFQSIFFCLSTNSTSEFIEKEICKYLFFKTQNLNKKFYGCKYDFTKH